MTKKINIQISIGDLKNDHGKYTMFPYVSRGATIDWDGVAVSDKERKAIHNVINNMIADMNLFINNIQKK